MIRRKLYEKKNHFDTGRAGVIVFNADRVVGSFYDSDGDGMGDLNGVTEKLDYITDLGCNGIWLMPIMPSPTYHKYDVED